MTFQHLHIGTMWDKDFYLRYRPTGIQLVYIPKNHFKNVRQSEVFCDQVLTLMGRTLKGGREFSTTARAMSYYTKRVHHRSIVL